MHAEGNTNAVIKAVKEKKRMLRSGILSAGAPRVGLLALSGVMRGTDGGGRVAGLEELGCTDVFDDLGGVSTGIPQILYFASGDARTGRTIYWDECTQGFISWRRGLTPRFLGGGPLASARFLSSVFRGEVGNKRLDEEAVRQSRSNIHLAFTDAETGEGLFLDAKTIKPDMVHGMEAGISIPGLSEGAVPVGGRKLVDGAGAMPFPLREFVIRTGVTHLLVLANAPGLKVDGKLGTALSALMLRKLSSPAYEAFMHRHERFNQDYEDWKRDPLCEWSILWSGRRVGSYSQDSHLIREASEEARIHTLQLFAST